MVRIGVTDRTIYRLCAECVQAVFLILIEVRPDIGALGMQGWNGQSTLAGLGALILIVFPFEEPARALSVPALRLV
jgi:hypothetical protein